jgi:hypothetical protein
LRPLQTNTDKSFTVYDFGVTIDDNTKVIPLGLQVYNTEKAGEDYLCSEIHNSNEGSQTYFAIIRQDNWSTASKQLFEPYALGLIYTLAVLFTVVAALGTIRIGFLLHSVIIKKSNFQILKIGLAVCIWLFTLSMYLEFLLY